LDVRRESKKIFVVLFEAISKLGFSFAIKKCPHLKNLGHRSRLLLCRPAERIFQPDGRDQDEKTFLRWLLSWTATESIVSFVSLYEHVIPPEKMRRRTPTLTFQKGSSYAKIP
jgi:hypothetical protein